MTIEIGIIKFLNSYPFWYNSSENPLQHVTYASPTELSNLFKAKTLVCSMISSHCYINMNLSDIELLPYVIAGNPKTNSTFLVLQHDTSKEDIQTIQLPTNSLTTSHLTKVCCHHFFHINPHYSHSDIIDTNKPFVIIGDEALRLDQSKYYVIDLAELWFQETGLPMCFGVWAKYKNINTSEIESAINQNIDLFFSKIASFTQDISDSQKLSKNTLTEYFEGLSYRLNESHIKSLELFKSLQSGIHVHA